jgi:hypothetical protein
MKDSFAGTVIHVDSYFLSLIAFLATRVCVEESDVILKGLLLYETCCFSLEAFNILFCSVHLVF